MKKNKTKTKTESNNTEKNTRKETVKKFFKSYLLVFILVIVLALGSIVTILASRKNDSLRKAEDSTTPSGVAENNDENRPATEIFTSTIMETKVITVTESDGKLVTKIVETPKVVTTIKTVKTDAKGSDNVKASDSNGKTEDATKKAAETTTKKAPTTTTTKRPVPTTKKEKDEYYPSLTKADMEEVKQYAINYIRKKGYKVEPQITWSNSTWGSVEGTDDNLAKYGSRYKKNGGIDPVEEAKRSIVEDVDSEIRATERANGPGSVAGVYPLIRHQDGGWDWAVGIW